MTPSGRDDGNGISEPAEHSHDAVDALDELVVRAIGGDEAAVAALLATVQPLVVRYCRSRLGRHEYSIGSAEDIGQEIMLAVLNALPKYRVRGSSFKSFVYGIAAHKVTDTFRAAGRNRSDPVADVPDGPGVLDGPEQRALREEQATEMRALLDRLTPQQREVLVMRVGVGMSAEEVAEILESTAGAVRVSQHRALNRLRRMLEAELVSGPPAAGRERPKNGSRLSSPVS